eukprot:3882792-Rhodomonas_salina.12
MGRQRSVGIAIRYLSAMIDLVNAHFLYNSTEIITSHGGFLRLIKKIQIAHTSNPSGDVSSDGESV